MGEHVEQVKRLAEGGGGGLGGAMGISGVGGLFGRMGGGPQMTDAVIIAVSHTYDSLVSNS